MSKKTQKVVEERRFDNVAYAEDVKAACEARIKRSGIAVILAIAASIVAMVGMTKENFPTYFGVTVALSIAAYIITGSLLRIIDSASTLGKIGWLIMPFPLDIATGMATVMAAMIIFLFCPTLFILISMWKNKKELREAEKYLSYCKEISNE